MKPEPYTAAGCERLAATVLHSAIRDMRKGSFTARSFLQSRRAQVFFDALGIERRAALDALGFDTRLQRK
ncbi:MAG: hypothetical protein V3R81_15380 [Gammaproteobacteria bacterium]